MTTDAPLAIADQGGPDMEQALDGWDIGHAEEKEWVSWGSTGDAKAKILATGDGYYVVLVQAEPGYTGDAHEHDYSEFSYVLDGEYRTQGQTLRAGDSYVAGPGSVHTDFTTEAGATYLSIFKL